MPRFKKTRKFAVHKNILKETDSRLKEGDRVIRKKKKDENVIEKYEAPQTTSALFFNYNTQLGPPYLILLDTNFINFSIKCKVDLIDGMTDCMYAKCIPHLTECVRGEMERLGERYKLALKILKDPRVKTLSCSHKGIYADDCIVERVKEHKCYIVATCDKLLKRRVRKIVGVPIMSVGQRKFVIERMGMGV
ncbi:rRNA-processing protein Fcf1/Utp23 [Trinorchestia longiramus]|nr:rRNA-processing protein Fcf1/Utp23 [Trinorchestia longiramus]